MIYSKITISGKICSGKTTLLKSLEKKLGWPAFMTGQLFREYAKKENLNLVGAEEQNERLTKAVDNKVSQMLHGPGNIIVDGWMSGISANNQPGVLRILLVCQDAIRYKRFAERENVDINTARRKVEERQNNWFEKIKKIHNINREEFTDKKNYSLVIDTSHSTPDEIIKLVLQKLQ